MKVWEGKQVIGFLLTWRLLWHQLQQQTKVYHFILLHWCPIGSYPSENPQQKSWKLNRQLIEHKEKVNFGELWIVTDSFVEQCM